MNLRMKPDAIIEVRFKTTAEGWKTWDILGAEYFGCPLFVDGEGFDCRLLLGGRSILLGQKYELPVVFLCPDLALPKLAPGKAITLWEGKDVATGRVVRLGD